MPKRPRTEEEIRAELQALYAASAAARQQELLPGVEGTSPPPVFPLRGSEDPLQVPPGPEIRCINCFQPILTNDPREDVCESCYYLLLDEMTDARVKSESRVVGGTRPYFHVP